MPFLSVLENFNALDIRKIRITTTTQTDCIARTRWWTKGCSRCRLRGWSRAQYSARSRYKSQPDHAAGSLLWWLTGIADSMWWDRAARQGWSTQREGQRWPHPEAQHISHDCKGISGLIMYLFLSYWCQLIFFHIIRGTPVFQVFSLRCVTYRQLLQTKDLLGVTSFS